jgi:CheY-like chemotaxis protein
MTQRQILVIDDEATVREVVSLCLTKLGGWQVLMAASGYEGLTLAQTAQPDAIVLDLRMPGMDGITVLQRLRENPDTETIPVVMLTANPNLPNARLFSELGVVAAIGKPFEPMLLVRQIATALGWHIDQMG